MSVEKESNDNSSGEAAAETTELVKKPAAPAAVGAKNELRIVLQVEVRTDISEGGADGKSGNKVTVVNHQIRSIIHVIGGGDVEREGEES
ncbi:MAG: hypothetical protein MUF34_13360 [Polyangiaceae bacterium]|jgi:hypothetical protein|nr:hypothetical protein [Polyangiaceae bacterium]